MTFAAPHTQRTFAEAKQSRARPRSATLALAATAWLMPAGAVHAQTAVTPAPEPGEAHIIIAGPAATGDGEVRIRTGRAVDLEGAPVYPARSTFSGTAAVATFSRRPIAVPRSLAPAAIAAHLPLRATVTSGFGMRVDPIEGTRRLHSGIDLAAPLGSPIVATSAGTVSRAGWNGGYGLYVALEHGAGLQTRYGHLSRLNVVAGQPIKQGEVIGYVGSTGRSTGPHLHFETRINGTAVRPVLTGQTAKPPNR